MNPLVYHPLPVAIGSGRGQGERYYFRNIKQDIKLYHLLINEMMNIIVGYFRRFVNRNINSSTVH